MSIRKKLLIRFCLILGIMMLAFLVSMVAMFRERMTKVAANQSAELAQATEDVRFEMMETRFTLSNYLLTGDTHEADKLRADEEKLAEAIQVAQRKALTDEQRSTFTELERFEHGWRDSFANVMIALRQNVETGSTTAAEFQTAYREMNPQDWVKNAANILDRVKRENESQLQTRKQADETAALFTTIVAIVCAIVAFGLGVFIAFRAAKSITQPLEELTAAASAISGSGDLDQHIDINRTDEVGQLATTFTDLMSYLKEMAAVSESIAGGDLGIEVQPRSSRDTLALAFSKMTHGLRDMVRTVRDAAAQVSAGSNQIADASEESAKISVQSASAIDEVTATMHEMSVNVQNMVKNTQMQASDVTETSASIDQMVANIQRVADTAKVLLDISNRSREEVQSGIGTMDKAADGLGRINDSIHSSADIISALGQRADDIGKIVEVIDDISEQTNLLALNAAIEAARAGEHGLGFAVVADEVRKLAEKSAESTKEISELIQRIQKEARKAVDNMDKSTSIVNEGLNLGSDLNMALHRISNVVTEVFKFAQEIGTATNEQAHGSTQIARATTRLNEITHEITSSVEEQASGAQAVVRAMERMREMVQHSTSGSTELAASSEQMSKMARSLLESMDRFIIDVQSRVSKSPDLPRTGGKALAARA